MFLHKYQLTQSSIPGAGKGIFLDEPAKAGSIVVAPDQIPKTFSLTELNAYPDQDLAKRASARWFENQFTITPEWPDECYINHSFEPSCILHLGFGFAARDLPVGTEITYDYRHLLAEGQEEEFLDAVTGEKIIGWSWQESLRRSLAELAEIHGLQV